MVLQQKAFQCERCASHYIMGLFCAISFLVLILYLKCIFLFSALCLLLRVCDHDDFAIRIYSGIGALGSLNS